jgi:hypothetical protein
MKLELEALLKANERILQIWEPDNVSGSQGERHMVITTRKDRSDSGFDADEVTVRLFANRPMDMAVEVRTVIEAMKQLEADPRIKKVIHQFHELPESANENATRRVGRVDFLIINTIDR